MSRPARGMALAGLPADNVYLQEARAADPDIERGGGSIWRPYPASWDARFRLQRKYAWAIPNDAALQALAALSPLVELGAGTGYWASLLARLGADVVAYDIKPGHNGWCEHDVYHPVQVGNWRPARAHADRALFLCWPIMDRFADKALRAYAGDVVAYIGEGPGGCTADDRFFARLDRDWTVRCEVGIPQWRGLHDYLTIYARKA